MAIVDGVQDKKDTIGGGEEAENKQSYSQTVRAVAQKGIYEFEYVDGPNSGKKVTLDRQKISVRKMTELERIRGEYNNLVTSLSSGDGSAANNTNKESSRLTAADKLTEIYVKCAEYYFHIEKDDFILMDWDTARVNIDAAASVSVFGRPNSP